MKNELACVLFGIFLAACAVEESSVANENAATVDVQVKPHYGDWCERFVGRCTGESGCDLLDVFDRDPISQIPIQGTFANCQPHSIYWTEVCHYYTDEGEGNWYWGAEGLEPCYNRASILQNDMGAAP